MHDFPPPLTRSGAHGLATVYRFGKCSDVFPVASRINAVSDSPHDPPLLLLLLS